MASFQELEALVYLTALVFVSALAAVKITGGFKANGFDLLAILVLAAASAKTYVKPLSFITEIGLGGLVVAALSLRSGAHRRAAIFLGAVVVFSDLLVEAERTIGAIDGLQNCFTVKVGVGAQAALFALVLYAIVATESGAEEEIATAKYWLVSIIALSVLRSWQATTDCSIPGESLLPRISSMIRILAMAAACLSYGSDEEPED